MKQSDHTHTLAYTISLLMEERKRGLKHLRDGRFKNLIREMLWAATEDKFDQGKDKMTHRKFKNQKFWSIGALRQYKKDNTFKGLQHEHVIPKDDYFQAIEKGLSISEIEKLLGKATSAIVRAEDHEKLSRSKKRGGFRYSDQKILVREVEWRDGKIKSHKPAPREFYRLTLD